MCTLGTSRISHLSSGTRLFSETQDEEISPSRSSQSHVHAASPVDMRLGGLCACVCDGRGDNPESCVAEAWSQRGLSVTHMAVHSDPYGCELRPIWLCTPTLWL